MESDRTGHSPVARNPPVAAVERSPVVVGDRSAHIVDCSPARNTPRGTRGDSVRTVVDYNPVDKALRGMKVDSAHMCLAKLCLAGS